MQFLLQEAFRERPLPFPGSDPQTDTDLGRLTGLDRERQVAELSQAQKVQWQQGGLETSFRWDELLTSEQEKGFPRPCLRLLLRNRHYAHSAEKETEAQRGQSQDRARTGILLCRCGVLSAVLQSGGLATRLPPVAIEARRGGLSRVVRAGSSVAAEGLLCRAGCPGAERLCSKWAFGGHLPAGLSCCPVGAAA